MANQLEAASSEVKRLHDSIEVLKPGIFESQFLVSQDAEKIEALRADASHAFRNTGKQTSNGASFIFAELDAMTRNVNRNAYLEDRLRERAHELTMYLDHESDVADELFGVDEEMERLKRQADELGGLMEVAKDMDDESSYIELIRKCERIEERCEWTLKGIAADILESEKKVAQLEAGIQELQEALTRINVTMTRLG